MLMYKKKKKNSCQVYTEAIMKENADSKDLY